MHNGRGLNGVEASEVASTRKMQVPFALGNSTTEVSLRRLACENLTVVGSGEVWQGEFLILDPS